MGFIAGWLGILPPSRLAFADGGGVSAEVDYDATATDNCDPDPEVSCVPPSGSTFPLGVTVVTCTATDECGNTTMETFNVEVIVEPECFLVVGDGPGSASFFDISHLFNTQVDIVEDQYPVLMDDIPEFVIPMPGRVHPGAPGQLGQGVFDGVPVGNAPLEQTPEWMLDGHFAVQVLMWNPTVFPGQPEQFSAGLEFERQPDGSWVATPYGTDLGGMTLWHEIDTNAAGQKVIRFPFDVPGW